MAALPVSAPPGSYSKNSNNCRDEPDKWPVVKKLLITADATLDMSTSIKEYIDVVIVVSALSTSFVGGVGGFLLRFECLITSLTPATALHARGVCVFMGSLWTNQQLSMEVKIWR